VRSATKIAGRVPIRRVTMGPNLAWRDRRIGSIFKADMRSHSTWPMKGKDRGPGGRFLVVKKLLKIIFKKREMEMETRIRNQLSILKKMK